MTSLFQSTLPAGGATVFEIAPLVACKDFNPRSPRGERLTPKIMRGGIRLYFNPRSPRGERLEVVFSDKEITAFQSTLPAGGATLD